MNLYQRTLGMCLGVWLIASCGQVVSLADRGSPGTKSSAKEMADFAVVVPEVHGTIDPNSRSIALVLPNGTSLKGLKVAIKVSPGATVSPPSGSVCDFDSPVTFTVTAEDNSSQSYTARVAWSSTDATLSMLAVSSSSLQPSFSPQVAEYQVSVSPAVTSLAITASPTNPAATVLLNPVSPVALHEGDNVVTIQVTLPSGPSKNYTVTVHRRKQVVVEQTAVDPTNDLVISIPADAQNARLVSLDLISGTGGQGGGGGGGGGGYGQSGAGAYGGGGGGAGSSGTNGLRGLSSVGSSMPLAASQVLTLKVGAGGKGGTGGSAGFGGNRTAQTGGTKGGTGATGTDGAGSELWIDGVWTSSSGPGSGGVGGTGGQGGTSATVGATSGGLGGVGTPSGGTGGLMSNGQGGDPGTGNGVGGRGGDGTRDSELGLSGAAGTKGSTGADGSIAIRVEYEE